MESTKCDYRQGNFRVEIDLRCHFIQLTYFEKEAIEERSSFALEEVNLFNRYMCLISIPEFYDVAMD